LALQQLRARPGFAKDAVFEPVLDAPVFQTTGAAIIMPGRGLVKSADGFDLEIDETPVDDWAGDEHVVGVHGKSIAMVCLHATLLSS